MAIFGQAEQCEQHDNACDRSDRFNHASLSHKGCCEDATLLIDSDKYRATGKITIESPQFIYLPEVSLVLEESTYENHFSNFSRYKPPIIKRDITLLVQAFLI